MAINPTQVKSMKPAPGKKVTRVYDGNGLYLFITEKGAKYWRFKSRFKGKELLLSLGTFPTVSLADARRKADDLKDLIKQGINPAEQRKAVKVAENKTADSFGAIAREWLSIHLADKAPTHSRAVIYSFKSDILPALGNRPIQEITTKELLDMLRSIEQRAAIETAHRVMNRCGQVFRFAIASGRCQYDPTTGLRGALKPVVSGHFAAVTEPTEVGKILRMIEAYDGSVIVRHAMVLAPLVFVRPGELRQAEWKDIDLDRAEWRFTTSKTKQQHIVPLSRQALEILREIHKLTGSGRFVFPGVSKSKALSNMAVVAGLRRIGITKDEMTAHGWRATARTLLDEVLKYPPHIIEQQLAHVVRDPLGRAYNRTTHLEERRKMMQAWADYLDELKR